MFRTRRGSLSEWLRWTGVLAIALPGFDARWTYSSLMWSVPLAGALAYVLLPRLINFRKSCSEIGQEMRDYRRSRREK